MADDILTVSDATFDETVGGSSNPVVVDFWAEWCGPCRAISPALEEISRELNGQVTIAKLNVDENPGVAILYGVRSIPTLIMFKNGEPIAQHIGPHRGAACPIGSRRRCKVESVPC